MMMMTTMAMMAMTKKKIKVLMMMAMMMKMMITFHLLRVAVFFFNGQTDTTSSTCPDGARSLVCTRLAALLELVAEDCDEARSLVPFRSGSHTSRSGS